VKNLSDEIRTAFPEMKGFSVRNLKYMIRFASTYDVSSIGRYDVLSITDNLNPETISSQYTDIHNDVKVQTAAALLPDNLKEKVQTSSALFDYYQFGALRLSERSWPDYITLIDRVIAEYSLKDLTKPIGVATYKLLPNKADLIALVEKGLKSENQLK